MSDRDMVSRRDFLRDSAAAAAALSLAAGLADSRQGYFCSPRASNSFGPCGPTRLRTAK